MLYCGPGSQQQSVTFILFQGLTPRFRGGSPPVRILLEGTLTNGVIPDGDGRGAGWNRRNPGVPASRPRKKEKQNPMEVGRYRQLALDGRCGEACGIAVAMRLLTKRAYYSETTSAFLDSEPSRSNVRGNAQ